MELVISAVEDVIVDSFEKNKYLSFPSQKIKAEDILRLVSERVGGDFDKVERIFVNMGPGSFTGIRASMALVVGLVAGKNIDIVPFTSFDALEYDILSAGQILAVNGFSNFVYVSYKKARKIVQECITIDDLIALSNQGNVVLSYSDKLLDQLSTAGAKIKKVRFSPEYAVQKFKQRKLEKIKFEPVYLRLSQAELQRKENKL